MVAVEDGFPLVVPRAAEIHNSRVRLLTTGVARYPEFESFPLFETAQTLYTGPPARLTMVRVE